MNWWFVTAAVCLPAAYGLKRWDSWAMRKKHEQYAKSWAPIGEMMKLDEADYRAAEERDRRDQM